MSSLSAVAGSARRSPSASPSTEHDVVVIDRRVEAFRRLGDDFKGTTMVGVGFDRDVLTEAGITPDCAVAAVTSGDNSNILIARVARETFGVEHVVARIYDPRRASIYERLGIATVASVAWTSARVLRHLLASTSRHPTGSIRRPSSRIVERRVPASAAGHVGGQHRDIVKGRVVVLARFGEATIPPPGHLAAGRRRRCTSSYPPTTPRSSTTHCTSQRDRTDERDHCRRRQRRALHGRPAAGFGSQRDADRQRPHGRRPGPGDADARRRHLVPRRRLRGRHADSGRRCRSRCRRGRHGRRRRQPRGLVAVEAGVRRATRAGPGQQPEERVDVQRHVGCRRLGLDSASAHRVWSRKPSRSVRSCDCSASRAARPGWPRSPWPRALRRSPRSSPTSGCRASRPSSPCCATGTSSCPEATPCCTKVTRCWSWSPVVSRTTYGEHWWADDVATPPQATRDPHDRTLRIRRSRTPIGETQPRQRVCVVRQGHPHDGPADLGPTGAGDLDLRRHRHRDRGVDRSPGDRRRHARSPDRDRRRRRACTATTSSSPTPATPCCRAEPRRTSSVRRAVRAGVDHGARRHPAGCRSVPAGRAATPAPALLEALPYRKDDLTGDSHADDYLRLRAEGGFAVCRLDVRGTGSSAGRATDEYPLSELDDLADVIAWLAAQPWCNGRVGMFGYSYSGFNSLQLACERPPALGAICAIYATDDRYTDDVHYMGGALRAIDLVDYCHYMVPMNALPPVPGAVGRRLARRVAGTDRRARAVAAALDGGATRRAVLASRFGAARTTARIECPTMIVAGWADGYRNNTFRTVRAAAVREGAADRSVEPHGAGDVVAGTAHRPRAGDDHASSASWLRDDPCEAAPADPCLRASRDQAASPTWPIVDGEWRYEDDVAAGAADADDAVRRAPPNARDATRHRDVAAWNSCAGGLPWGQPLDQRNDDAWSLTTDWPVAEPTEILGHVVVQGDGRRRINPIAYLSVKLNDVWPDGTSALVTRGLLNLTPSRRSAGAAGARRAVRDRGRDGGDVVGVPGGPLDPAQRRRHRLAQHVGAAASRSR